MRKSCAAKCSVYTSRRLHGNRHCLLAKISPLEQKKSVVHCMMKSPNSMLSTNCRMVAIGMMERHSLWFLQESYISIQFLNQFDKNPLRVLQIVGLVFVELVLEDESLCCHILQLPHIFVQPLTNLHCFFVVNSLIHWLMCTLSIQHERSHLVAS